jgi:Tripartite tricarboxylate transporter TctB family
MAQGGGAEADSADDELRVPPEDADDGMVTPIMDLIAAGIIAAIAIFIAIDSLFLPVPGGQVFTAPGLLPFLTSASLLIMTAILASSALTRRRTLPRALDRFEMPPDIMRSLTLGVIVIVYVAALQFVPVDVSFNIGSQHFVIGAFETVSVVAITALLKLYWRAPLWACLAVSVGWIAFLSIVFRMLFQTPLP